MNDQATPAKVRLTDGLGPLLEEAASDCLAELAGVDTYDVNLRDNQKAWEALEALAAQVRDSERERLAGAWRAAHGYDRMGVADWIRRA